MGGMVECPQTFGNAVCHYCLGQMCLSDPTELLLHEEKF